MFNGSIPRRVFDRLLYITCSQNWEAMGGHFWIKQCIEVRRCLTFKVPEMKIVEFANGVDLDEVAHYEPPHLDLHCLPFSL